MTSRNPITGDKLQSKPATKEYRDNYDLIFKKDSGFNLEEEIKKETKKQLAAKWYQENKEEVKARSAAYYEANKEACKERFKQNSKHYHETHAEERAAAQKERSITPKGKYLKQKSHAQQRGIPWEFTFESWWDVWEKSGKWEQRGRESAEAYVMCRKGDTGPYSPENVRIETVAFNTRERFSSVDDAIFGKAGYSKPEDACCGKCSPCKGHEVENQKEEDSAGSH